MPLVLILIWGVFRFMLGAYDYPYAPRGNAMFSMVGLTLISCLYFGALSRSVGAFKWWETLVMGATMGVYVQVLILLATALSLQLGLENSYFLHWDALNVPEGTRLTASEVMTRRVPAVIAGAVLPAILALIGRLFACLVPGPMREAEGQ
jgi:hypothetical protein